MKLCSSVSIIPNSMGSASFSSSGTTAISTVHNSNTLDVRIRSWSRTDDKYFSSVVTKILLNYLVPGAPVQINVNVVGSKSNILFCSLNAALLALLDGGVPLSAIFYPSTSFNDDLFIFDHDNLLFYHAFSSVTQEQLQYSRSLVDVIRQSHLSSLHSKFIGIN